MIATQITVKDPVCGMDIHPAQAAGQREYSGTTYFFCSEACQKKFDADPAQYATAASERAPEASRKLLSVQLEAARRGKEQP